MTLSACRREDVTAPTCEELIRAYEAAGYHVFHSDNVYKEDGTDWECYVKVWLDDESEYAFFYFFETAEAAEARDAEREYHILIYLFSVIYGDPSWLYTETYGNIEYEYDDPKLIEPFKVLIR